MNGRIGTKSITYAMRAKELLAAVRIPSEVVRLRPDESPGGCAYGVEFPYGELSRAVTVLTRENVKFTILRGKL